MSAAASKFLTAAAVAVAVQFGVTSLAAAQDNPFGVDLAPNKRGTIDEMEDISKYCGTEPLKVAYADGWGGNYWRQITRAEFELEAAKCPNITEIAYSDGEFSAEKHISDIRGFIAQDFDVIVVFPDTGVAVLDVLREAQDAGVAVVPFTTGDNPYGELGVDYTTRVTETQIGLGKMLAEWMVEALDGEGNVIVHGGTPGNPMTASQAIGWREVFSQNPGITVLEGPSDTNWDPALAQRVAAAQIAKYDQIDGFMAETVGPIRAFVAAGRPIPAWAGQDLNALSCLWEEHFPTNPTFEMANASAHTWLVRLALRKGVAAANGIDNLEPSLIDLPFSENTLSDDPKHAVQCKPDLPALAIPSAMVPGEMQKEILGGN